MFVAVGRGSFRHGVPAGVRACQRGLVGGGRSMSKKKRGFGNVTK